MPWIQLTMLGGLVALDGTSVGQFMLSRPLVAATLAGWIMGDPLTGLQVGVLLELLFLAILPAGGARFPDVGPAALVGAVAAVHTPGPGGLALAVLLALVWGEVGGSTITVLRHLNGRLAPDLDPSVITVAHVRRSHMLGILLDFLRGSVVAASGIAAAALLGPVAAGGWPLALPDTIGLLLLGVSIPLGVLLRQFGGIGRRSWFFGMGLVVGLAGALLL